MPLPLLTLARIAKKANKVKFELTDESQELLERVNKKAQDFANEEVERILYENAKVVSKEMKEEVPVDTGRLKRNIRVNKVRKSALIESVARDPSSRKDYAPIIENYGGRYQKGIYYFTNGIRRLKDRVNEELRTGLRQIPKKARSRFGPQYRGKRGGTFTPRK